VFEPFIDGRIDEKLITAYWNDVLRLATSIRTGAASASLLRKRLGAYPRTNGLTLALREIGRIERTLFMLDWLELPGLRRQATAELNKGEARNALARAVCFHRLGRLRDRAAEAQQYRASGLALVTAAIALWNTVYLGRALDVPALRRRNHSGPIAFPPCPGRPRPNSRVTSRQIGRRARSRRELSPEAFETATRDPGIMDGMFRIAVPKVILDEP
jgi:TnpA family transposase